MSALWNSTFHFVLSIVRLTKKQLLRFWLSYTATKPLWLGQYVRFSKGFCHGSWIARISYSFVRASARSGAITLSLLFCTLYYRILTRFIKCNVGDLKCCLYILRPLS